MQTTAFAENKLYLQLCKVLNNRFFILTVFALIPLITSYRQYHTGTHHNNYLIFIYTYFHAADHLSLFARYPAEYGDMNHYGPLFALLIAPIARLPEFLGMFTWELANSLFLYYAIQTLPLETRKVNAVYWIILNELITSLFACQINPSITGIIILSYTLIDRKQNFWAAFFIMLGTFIKLYGIVGLAFFFFARQKPRFIASCIFWGLFFFTLPMLFFGVSYVLGQYQEWYLSLSAKQLENATLVSWQDISIMGIVRRVLGNPDIGNLPFLVPGVLLFCAPYLRTSQYSAPNFRLMYLASTLIFTVIFSNSSESPTYIIAFAGVAIWLIIQDRPLSPEIIALFVFAILLTTLAPTDLYPRYIRQNYIMKYSLKALPCVCLWFFISYQLLFKVYQQQPKLTP